MSNSYTSGAPSSSIIYQRSNSIDDETETGSFDHHPAPTRSTAWMRNITERDLTEGESYFGQGLSIADAGRGAEISVTGSSGLIHQNNAPDVDGHVRPNLSQIDQDKTSYGAHKPPPGMSGQARPNNSESAHQPSPADPQDHAGFSSGGKKFKEVNPTAYYVEK